MNNIRMHKNDIFISTDETGSDVRKSKRLWETNLLLILVVILLCVLVWCLIVVQDTTQLETKKYSEYEPSHSNLFHSDTKVKICNKLVYYLVYLLSIITKDVNHYLLKNASECETYEIDGKTYFLENTCHFDSIAQIVFISILDNPVYRSKAEISNNPFFNFIFNFINYGANHQIYTERFILLKPLYEETKKIEKNEHHEYFYSYNAFDNLDHVWMELFKSVPSMYQTKQCDNCGKHETKEFMSMSINNTEIIIKEGFRALEKALQFNPIIRNEQCDHCRSNCTQVTEKTNDHIFIDLNISTIHQSGAKYKLKDLPTVLKLTKQYRLAGVIENQRQHYVAYCKRLVEWEQYDDLNTEVKFCTSNETIIPVGAIYTCIEN